MNAKNAAFAAGICNPLVLGVDVVCGYSEICNPVVVFNSIDMVDLAVRPFAIEMQPSKSVCAKAASPEFDINVAFGLFVASHIADSRSSVIVRNPSCKNASDRVVVKKLAKPLSGMIEVSHEAPLMLIGQRPRAIAIRFGASPFYLQ